MVAPSLCHINSIKNYPISMGTKLQTGYRVAPSTRTDWNPIKKKADPITRFAPNFSDDPRCAPIKSYRGRALRGASRLFVIGVAKSHLKDRQDLRSFSLENINIFLYLMRILKFDNNSKFEFPKFRNPNSDFRISFLKIWQRGTIFRVSRRLDFVASTKFGLREF